jgi:hypothetical protein
MKKIGFIGIIQLVCAALSGAISLSVLLSQKSLTSHAFLRWFIFLYVLLMLLSNVLLSHRFSHGRLQEILFLLSTSLLVSNLLGYVLYCLIRAGFDFKMLDWFGFLEGIVAFDGTYYGIVLVMFIAFVAVYCYFIDRRMLLMIRSGITGKGKLKQVETNLENSRWMRDDERDKIFKPHKYSKLHEVTKDGIPVMAKLTDKDKDMKVVFNSPCHSLIIGSTGSGKTTTFVNPMIQLIGASGAGSSSVGRASAASGSDSSSEESSGSVGSSEPSATVSSGFSFSLFFLIMKIMKRRTRIIAISMIMSQSHQSDTSPSPEEASLTSTIA